MDIDINNCIYDRKSRGTILSFTLDSSSIYINTNLIDEKHFEFRQRKLTVATADRNHFASQVVVKIFYWNCCLV
jgi:hypothetical protein